MKNSDFIVHPSGYANKSKCGYCGSQRSSSMFGVGAQEMSVATYQQLMDRGFRRSGTYVYKPDQRNSCCVMYTIRLDVAGYKPTKEHRQVANRFMKHFNTPPGNTTKISRSHKGKNNTFDLDRSMEVVSDRLRIVLDTSEVTPEKYDLYKRYQVTIHNDDEDDVSEDQFKRFLCDNPFTDYTEPDDANPRGHFHQLYYWDNTLFAIGVIDVLPLCVSSVYFVWDPAWAKWGLGKLGSLQEIALTRRLGLPYYYMGFYIHDCVKMRYKGQFSPSYLLDPWFTEYDHNSQHADLSDAVDGVWFPLTRFDKLLDKKKLVSLLKPDATYDGKSRFKSLQDAGMPGVLKQEDLLDVAFDKMPVMFKIDNQTALLTPDLFAGNGANIIRGILKDIVAAVGKAIGSTIVLDMSVYA